MPSINKTILLLVAITPILMADECGVYVPNYGAAHISNETAYLAKPVYTDTCERAFYVSGRFSHTVIPYYENEKTWFGEISLHRSHTWKHANLSYGAFGFGGQRKVYLVEEYRGNKSFGGVGMTAELNANIPFKKVDWRVIGVRTTMYYEGGEYAAFRTDAAHGYSSRGAHFVDNNNPGNFPVNLTFYSELIVKLKKLDFGIYTGLGITFGDGGNALTATLFCLHVTHKRMTYFVQYAGGDLEGNTIAGGVAFRINKNTAAPSLKRFMAE